MQNLRKENPLINGFESEISALNTRETSNDNTAKEIIDRLVNLMLIEQVYYNTFKFKQTTFKELIILIPDSRAQHITEVRPLINMIMSFYPGYRYRVFYMNEVKQDIQKGNIIFFSICRSEELLYSSPDCTDSLLTKNIPTSEILEKGKRTFQYEFQKIISFKKGMQFYFERKDYKLTAFMLHQVIESCFRMAELFAIGRAKSSHSIRNHISNIQPYIKELGQLFNKNSEIEMKLLNLLDDAYSSVRYENNYSISKDQLALLILKAERAESLVHESCEAILLQIEHDYKVKEEHLIKESSLNPIKTTQDENNSSNSPLDLFIEQIITKFPIERIFCISKYYYTSESKNSILSKIEKSSYAHYELLIINTDPIENIYAQFGKTTFMKSNTYTTITPLFHSKETLREKTDPNQYFFQRILQQSEQVYVKPGAPIHLEYVASCNSLSHSQIELHWKRRVEKANILLNTAANIEKGCEDLIIGLINSSMKQVCLGFIYVYLEYTPNYTSLSHLINLCRIITDQINEYFPGYTEEDKKILDLLCEGWSNVNQKHEFIDPTYVDLLMGRSNEWLKQVKKMVESKMEDKKGNHSPSLLG